MTSELGSKLFRRLDESDDELFYTIPRLVVHIDEAAIASVGTIFGQRLPRGGFLLDLMSSWRSHLPPELRPSKVVGLGLNQTELEENPALTEFVVHDLNRAPRLPFERAASDGAMLTVSVQYLTDPIAVFREVGRVLKPDAPFVVTFSNRMFPTKAVAVWRASNDWQRVGFVRSYFQASEVFEKIEVVDMSRAPPLDPLYGVIGYRRARDAGVK